MGQERAVRVKNLCGWPWRMATWKLLDSCWKTEQMPTRATSSAAKLTWSRHKTRIFWSFYSCTELGPILGIELESPPWWRRVGCPRYQKNPKKQYQQNLEQQRNSHRVWIRWISEFVTDAGDRQRSDANFIRGRCERLRGRAERLPLGASFRSSVRQPRNGQFALEARRSAQKPNSNFQTLTARSGRTQRRFDHHWNAHSSW